MNGLHHAESHVRSKEILIELLYSVYYCHDDRPFNFPLSTEGDDTVFIVSFGLHINFPNVLKLSCNDYFCPFVACDNISSFFLYSSVCMQLQTFIFSFSQMKLLPSLHGKLLVCLNLLCRFLSLELEILLQRINCSTSSMLNHLYVLGDT